MLRQDHHRARSRFGSRPSSTATSYARSSRKTSASAKQTEIHVRRLGQLAAAKVREGSVVIVAAVSPYKASRDEVRDIIGAERFVEVFVDTPVSVCEQRDVKGMYGEARRGERTQFTGVDDPYEPPDAAAVRLDTIGRTADENAMLIVECLRNRGLM